MDEKQSDIILHCDDDVLRDVVAAAVENRFGRKAVFAAEGFPVEASAPQRLGAVLDRIGRSLKSLTPRIRHIAFGPFRLDVDESVLTDAGGKKTRLTEKERDILAALHGAGGVMPRKVLLNAVWGYADGIETHTLETHIYRLRRKIERDPAAPEYLLTEEPGYRLAGI